MLKVWIGHYKGNPKEWFVVWAKSKNEAFLQIDPLTGEPDLSSFMELTAPGFVDFAPKDNKGEYFDYRSEGLYFGGGLGKLDDVDGHIRNRMKKAKR